MKTPLDSIHAPKIGVGIVAAAIMVGTSVGSLAQNGTVPMRGDG